MPTILDTSGIATCVVSYGKESSFAGLLANVRIQITPKAIGVPTLRLVWAATGDVFSSFVDSTSGDSGMPGTIVLPQTGQSGFKLGTATFRDWFYEAIVVATLADGQMLSRVYRFQIPAGQTTLDLDTLDEDGVVTALPAVAPILPEPAGLSDSTRAALSATYLPLPTGTKATGMAPVVQPDGSVQWATVSGSGGTSIVDNGDGTLSSTSSSIVDNGDGTLTAA